MDPTPEPSRLFLEAFSLRSIAYDRELDIGTVLENPWHGGEHGAQRVALLYPSEEEEPRAATLQVVAATAVRLKEAGVDRHLG